MTTVSCHSNQSSYPVESKTPLFVPPAYRWDTCVKCGKNRFHGLRGNVIWKCWRWTDDEFQTVYTTSSPMSRRLRWAKNVISIQTEERSCLPLGSLHGRCYQRFSFHFYIPLGTCSSTPLSPTCQSSRRLGGTGGSGSRSPNVSCGIQFVVNVVLNVLHVTCLIRTKSQRRFQRANFSWETFSITFDFELVIEPNYQ